MLRHIALILLCLLVALPAVAAPSCHTQPVQTATHHGMQHSEMHNVADDPASGGQTESGLVKQHPCVGCITAIALPKLAPSFALAHMMIPSLAAIVPLEGLAHLPVLPPPRS